MCKVLLLFWEATVNKPLNNICRAVSNQKELKNINKEVKNSFMFQQNVHRYQLIHSNVQDLCYCWPGIAQRWRIISSSVCCKLQNYLSIYSCPFSLSLLKLISIGFQLKEATLAWFQSPDVEPAARICSYSDTRAKGEAGVQGEAKGSCRCSKSGKLCLHGATCKHQFWHMRGLERNDRRVVCRLFSYLWVQW